jgi:alanine dehydrogenase
MRRFGVLFLAVFAFGLAGASMASAAVRHYEKLSLDEQIALSESESRVVAYDRNLVTLDRERRHHQISADAYQWKSSALISYIGQESLFQNAILVRKSNLPQNAREVLETMGHGLLMIPIGVGYVVAACPQVLQFLACIH